MLPLLLPAWQKLLSLFAMLSPLGYLRNKILSIILVLPLSLLASEVDVVPICCASTLFATLESRFCHYLLSISLQAGEQILLLFFVLALSLLTLKRHYVFVCCASAFFASLEPDFVPTLCFRALCYLGNKIVSMFIVLPLSLLAWGAKFCSYLLHFHSLCYLGKQILSLFAVLTICASLGSRFCRYLL